MFLQTNHNIVQLQMVLSLRIYIQTSQKKVGKMVLTNTLVKDTNRCHSSSYKVAEPKKGRKKGYFKQLLPCRA